MEKQINKLLKDRYFLKNEKSWNDIAERVGSLYPEMTNEILEMNFIPSSPTLMNACTNGERVGTLSSCFPMSIDDSIECIFDSVKECAIVTKYGGGIGLDFSNLRSSQESVKGIGNRNSSGPLPFIQIFDAMLDGVQQGGARRGAGMALLDINHPDIIEFIKAKDDLNAINRFNMSIMIDSAFYEKLENDPDSLHYVTYKDGSKHKLTDDGNDVTIKDLWNLIIKHSHKMAEPGIFNSSIAFDRCTVTNVNEKVICNPCSEFVSIPYSSCNLGSINLSNMYDEELNLFNWQKFERLVVKSVTFLNKVIDNNVFPIEKIKEVTNQIRPIGLGTMGLAHLFFKMGIPYNSKRARKLTEDIFKYMTLRGMQQSIELAKAECAYPTFDAELFLKANDRFFHEREFMGINLKRLKEDIKVFDIRNSGITSIAPTGSIAVMANSSGGIEPIFALCYTRKVEKLNKEYDLMLINDPVFDDYLNKNFAEDKIKIMKFIADNKGSCQECPEIPDDIKKIFVTAADLTPKEHLSILSAVAVNISYSCSKTINIPNDATEEDISKVFFDAHKQGVIGVTVYRDGCRDGILVHTPQKTEIKSLKNGDKFELPDVMKSKRINMSTSKGKASLFVVLDENKLPLEFYVNPPTESPEQAAIMTAICRLIAVGIQGYQDIDEYLDQLKKANKMYENRSSVLTYITKSLKASKSKNNLGIEVLLDLPVEDEDEVIVQCIYNIMKLAQDGHSDLNDYIHVMRETNQKFGNISSIVSFLIKAFNKFIEVLAKEDGKVVILKEVCPECSQKLILKEGCAVCSSCTYSKCG